MTAGSGLGRAGLGGSEKADLVHSASRAAEALPFSTDQVFQRGEIFIAGSRDNFSRQARSGGLLIPFDGEQVIANELLVVARGRLVGRVAFRWPVARRIGRQYLVDEKKISGRIGAKLEFGIGKNHAGLL